MGDSIPPSLIDIQFNIIGTPIPLTSTVNYTRAALGPTHAVRPMPLSKHATWEKPTGIYGPRIIFMSGGLVVNTVVSGLEISPPK